MLQFATIALDKIGGRTNLQDRQWAILDVGLDDAATGHRRGVEVRVLVPKRPDATMRELEEAARTDAIASLEAVLALLKESTVDQLAAREWAADHD